MYNNSDGTKFTVGSVYWNFSSPFYINLKNKTQKRQLNFSLKGERYTSRPKKPTQAFSAQLLQCLRLFRLLLRQHKDFNFNFLKKKSDIKLPSAISFLSTR
jgi:hypothetical protein